MNKLLYRETYLKFTWYTLGDKKMQCSVIMMNRTICMIIIALLNTISKKYWVSQCLSFNLSAFTASFKMKAATANMNG